MQNRTKKKMALTIAVFVVYAFIQVLRSPQADTRRIAREQRQRARTWNGMYDQSDVLESHRRGW